MKNSWHVLDGEAGVCFFQLMVCSVSCRSVNNFLMTGPKVRDIPLIYIYTLQSDFCPVRGLLCRVGGPSHITATCVVFEAYASALYSI